MKGTDFIAWCRHVANSDDVVILDTETTGLGGEVIELAAITPKGDVVYSGLLRPLCTIESGAQETHHITMSMLEHAPTIKEEWDRILACLEGKTIITYGAAFDSERIEQTAWAHRCFPKRLLMPKLTYECALLRYAAFYNAPPRWSGAGPAWQKLEDACRQQGVMLNPSHMHRAYADACATLALIRQVAMAGENARRYRQEA